jgi:hypothetical protein
MNLEKMCSWIMSLVDESYRFVTREDSMYIYLENGGLSLYLFLNLFCILY